MARTPHMGTEEESGSIQRWRAGDAPLTGLSPEPTRVPRAYSEGPVCARMAHEVDIARALLLRGLVRGPTPTAKRRRFKQSISFQDRLASFANEAREKAARLPPGPTSK